jgi:uncharacterized protein
VSFFKEYNFLVGLSLDGPPELHDFYRKTLNKKPTYHLIHPKINLLKKFDIAFNVLMTLNNITIHHPGKLYSFCIENGINFVQFIPIVEFLENGKPAPFSIPAEKYGDFLCQLFELWYNNGNPLISIRMFEAFLHQVLNGENTICSYRKFCNDYLVVEGNGDVYPCDFFVEPGWKLGNLLEEPLWEIEKNFQRKHFAERKVCLDLECEKCQWFCYCNGDCPRYRIQSNKSYFCEGHKQFFSFSLPYFRKIIKKIRENQNISIGRNEPCPCGSGKKYKKCCA